MTLKNLHFLHKTLLYEDVITVITVKNLHFLHKIILLEDMQVV